MTPRPSPAGGDPRGSQVLPWLAAALAVAATTLDAVRSLWLAGIRTIDEDVAIYWYATQEFAHLHLREPFFYGQAYNHLGEAALAAPLTALGVPIWVGPVAVSLAVGLAPWVLLALLAWRRGARGLAVILLGAPALMPAGYQMILMRFFGMGLLLVAAALLVADSSRGPWRWLWVGLLLSVGALAVPNALPLAAAGLAWLAATRPGSGRGWLLAAAGAAGGLALYALGWSFYARNPGWALHPAPGLDLRLALVGDALLHLDRHLGRVTPWALVHPAVPLTAVLGLAVLAVRRHLWAVAGPALALLAVALAAFALEKVHQGTPSAFFAHERMFLGVPLALALVAVAAAEARLWTGLPSTGGALAGAALVAALAVPKQVALARSIEAEMAAPQPVLRRAEVAEVRRTCRDLALEARDAGTDLVVFLQDRTLAYACGALGYGAIRTLYPEYERRTWLLQEESRARRSSVLLCDVEPGPACLHVAARVPGALCAPAGPSAVAVRYGPGPVLDLVRSLGMPVRPF